MRHSSLVLLSLVAAAVAGCAADERERATAWQVSGVSPGGLTVTNAYQIGDPHCEQFERVEQEERASSVALRVVVRHVLDAGPCADVLRGETASVRLREPLGGRRLVDG
jgi:hypothetical protein